MLRIGVCDDDREFRQRLVQMIRIWSDHSGIPTELYPFDNGDELIAKNAAFRMDIILLDIVMPLLNGMDTARELRAGYCGKDHLFDLLSGIRFGILRGKGTGLPAQAHHLRAAATGPGGLQPPFRGGAEKHGAEDLLRLPEALFPRHRIR